MRIFIAIDLSPEIKAQLASVVKLLKPFSSNIKWVAPENYHLTLKFIGEVEEQKVEIIRQVLEKVVQGHRAFSLSVKGAGSFPAGQSRMRVIWIGLHSGPELYSLQADLEEALSREGFSREDRPFSPHLTIGRARQPQKQEKLKIELDRLGQKEFGMMEVREIELFQSILRPEGPEYKIISRHYLK